MIVLETSNNNIITYEDGLVWLITNDMINLVSVTNLTDDQLSTIVTNLKEFIDESSRRKVFNLGPINIEKDHYKEKGERKTHYTIAVDYFIDYCDSITIREE